ncbi:MAG: phosphoribosylglycinamide formyltransferase [Phycisphaerales bacterium]
MSDPLRIAALISGTGRTLINILDKIDAGELNASVELVIASRGAIAGVELSEGRGLEVRIVRRRDFAGDDQMHDAISAALTEKRIELVCLCGYLRWFRVDDPFAERVMNIHPALLPEFGGQDMHGQVVHQAVLDSGGRLSGCTVHFVDEEYDHGPIILQRTCPVLRDDDHESLAARVFALECQAYPEAIRLFGAHRLSVNDDRVHILPV